jgi:hypothetical protein
LRIATVILVMLVRVEKQDSQWSGFNELWYLRGFFCSRKFVEKIHVSLKRDKNDGYFAWRMFYVYDASLRYA